MEEQTTEFWFYFQHGLVWKGDQKAVQKALQEMRSGDLIEMGGQLMSKYALIGIFSSLGCVKSVDEDRKKQACQEQQ